MNKKKAKNYKKDYKWTISEFLKLFSDGYDGNIPEWMKNNIDNPDIFLVITKEEIITTGAGCYCRASVKAVDKDGNPINISSQDKQPS